MWPFFLNRSSKHKNLVNFQFYYILSRKVEIKLTIVKKPRILKWNPISRDTNNYDSFSFFFKVFNEAKCFYRKPVYHRHSRIKYCLLLSRIDKKFQLNFIVKWHWFKKLSHFKSHCQKYYSKCVICSVIKIFFDHRYPLPISQHFAFHNWKCGLLNVGSTFSNSL